LQQNRKIVIMSKEAVMALFKASDADPALNARLKAADSPATVVNLAKEQGYEFDEAEYAAVVQEVMTQGYEELEDSRLKSVAGGTTKPPFRTDEPPSQGSDVSSKF